MIIFLSILYFFLNPSYKLSLEAKYFFEIENFDKAYELATKAYKINPYNIMAFTIKTQSKIAKEWQNFIKDADIYFEKIKKIASQKIVNKKEKQKIKIMLEIIISEYKLLKPSLLIPKKLKEEAKKRYKKAKEIYERIFDKRDQ